MAISNNCFVSFCIDGLFVNYFYLYSGGLNPNTLDRESTDWSRLQLCGGCNQPTSIDLIEIPVQASPGGRVPLSGILAIEDIGIIREDLLEAFPGQIVEACHSLGKVRVKKRVVPGWRAFTGRHKVVVRGTADAAFRRCKSCGGGFYYAGWPKYLCPAPPESFWILHGGYGELVIRGELLPSVERLFKGKLRISPLPVLDHPKDNLPFCLSDAEPLSRLGHLGGGQENANPEPP